MSVRKGNDILAGSAPIKIDSALNPASANPVQNGVIAAAINSVISAINHIDCGTMS